MAWDPVWEKVFRESEWGKYPSESLIRFIARNFYRVPKRKDIKILEVGCGPGANLWYMKREGFTVYGIDGSETAIKRAEKRLEEDVPADAGKSFLELGDITRLPYPDDFFDAVIDVEATYANSVEDAKKIFSEMYRVVKKGGTCYSRMFAEGTWGMNETGIVAEGPLAGKGYARMARQEDIASILSDWKIDSIDLEMHTIGGVEHQHWIKEWVIYATK